MDYISNFPNMSMFLLLLILSQNTVCAHFPKYVYVSIVRCQGSSGKIDGFVSGIGTGGKKSFCFYRITNRTKLNNIQTKLN